MTRDQNVEQLRAIKSFSSLVKYLRDELNWPIESDNFEDIFFEWNAQELGIDAASAAKIEGIKQLRPLSSGQPWGIFFIKFEPKKLPVVALRRILSRLVIKKRSQKADQAAWHEHDLLFISNYGEGDDRQITFAQFSQLSEKDLPTLRVLGWDDADTALHLDYTHQVLKEKLVWREEYKKDSKTWRETWSEAFVLRNREVIETSKDLAEQLAQLAQRIRKRAKRVLRIESDTGPLRQLHVAFQKALIHDLDQDSFADMYAQTIAYGLLAARMSRQDNLVADHISDMVPVTNPFLKELLDTFLNVGGRKAKIDFDELGIQDIVELLNDPNTKIDAILRDFGNKTRQEDPVVHFYESFLKAYDAELKFQRGVFYTPQPVVSYIVRSVHELLQDEFQLEDGLASTVTWGEMTKREHRIKVPEGTSPDSFFVQILDPAIGTGTFLVEIIDVVYKHMTAKWIESGYGEKKRDELWNDYVAKCLLPRLYGYEIMMAPYTVAHMKIGLKLVETGYRFGVGERLRVYLTNSLEPATDDHIGGDWFYTLAHEAQAVNAIKHQQRFTVVIGNPPYAYMSSNLTKEASKLIDQYKYVDNQRIVERGAISFERALQDDYVKFFGLTQRIIDQAGVGCISMITNSAYLHNPNMRGMRNSFMRNFKFFFNLNLHGDLKKLQTGDQNVFDIRTGVAIALLVRGPIKIGTKFSCSLSDITGTRAYKEHMLEKSTLLKDCLESFLPKPPQYLFDLKANQESEYNDWIPVSQIFSTTSVGIKSCRDHLVIGHNDKDITTGLKVFIDPTISDPKIKEILLLDNSAQWKIVKSRKRCRDTFSNKYFSDVAYRPFDNRRIYYHPSVVSSPRPAVMQNLIKHNNLAFITNRRIRTEAHAHFFVVNTICMAEMLSSADNCNVYPIMLIGDDLLQEYSERSNFSTYFMKKIATTLNMQQNSINGLPNKLTADQIFYYLYAVFYSPSYRNLYANFLKIDFPRLPLTSNLDLLLELAKFGGELTALHIMTSPKLEKKITKFVGNQTPEVEKVTWLDETVWIDKAETIGFAGVSEQVWSFYIGGYQVCEKWLKDRKGRKLSKEDIEHYQKIIVALDETIKIMAEIDKVIDVHGGWPGAFQAKAS